MLKQQTQNFEQQLILAAKEGKYDEVKYYLQQNGINVNARITNGNLILNKIKEYTALQAAVINGYPRIVELLLAAGADVTLPILETISPGYYISTLAWSVGLNHEEIVKLLLDQILITNPKRLDDTNIHGATALYTAAAENSKEAIVRLLLTYGGDYNIKALDGTYPLEVAQIKFSDKSNYVKAFNEFQIKEQRQFMSRDALNLFNKIYFNRKKLIQTSSNQDIFALDNQLTSNNQPFYLQQSAKNWVTAIGDEFDSKTKDIFAQSLKDTLSNLSDKALSPLIVDINVISNVYEKLKINTAAPQMVVKFAEYAQTIVNHYQTQVNLLSNQLIDVNNPLVKQIQMIANDMLKLNPAIDIWTNNIKDASKDIHSFAKTINELPLPIELKTVMQTVEKTSGSVTHAMQIAQQIIDKVVNIATGADEAFNKVAKYENELIKFAKYPALNSEEKLQLAQTKANLKMAQSEYNKQNQLRSETLKNLGQAVDFVGTVFSAIGEPKLAEQIATVGMATISIVENIGAIMAGSAVLGPVGLIGGAVVSILSVFGVFGSSEPSEKEKLSNQITKLGEHLDARFDHMEAILKTTREEMHGRFDRLEGILGDMYYHIQQRFDAVEALISSAQADTIKEFRVSLQKATEIISHQIEKLEKKIDDGFKDLTIREYKNLRDKALNLSRISDKVARQTAAEDSSRELKAWAIDKAKSPSITGQSGLDDSDLWHETMVNGVAFRINAIADSEIVKANKINMFSIVNPVVWADTVRTYLQLLQTPNINVNWKYKEELKQMLDTGQNVNKFIKKLQISDKFFISLCQEYRNKMNMVLDDENADLTKFDTISQLLSLFARLAFNRSMLEDATLHSVLLDKLWTKLDLEFYKANSNYKIQIRELIRESCNSVVDELEQLLLVKIAEAQKYNLPGYPLIDTVSNEVFIYSISYQPQSNPIVSSASPIVSSASHLTLPWFSPINLFTTTHLMLSNIYHRLGFLTKYDNMIHFAEVLTLPAPEDIEPNQQSNESTISVTDSLAMVLVPLEPELENNDFDDEQFVLPKLYRAVTSVELNSQLALARVGVYAFRKWLDNDVNTSSTNDGILSDIDFEHHKEQWQKQLLKYEIKLAQCKKALLKDKFNHAVEKTLSNIESLYQLIDYQRSDIANLKTATESESLQISQEIKGIAQEIKENMVDYQYLQQQSSCFNMNFVLFGSLPKSNSIGKNIIFEPEIKTVDNVTEQPLLLK